jgi:hypothetical protein
MTRDGRRAQFSASQADRPNPTSLVGEARVLVDANQPSPNEVVAHDRNRIQPPLSRGLSRSRIHCNGERSELRADNDEVLLISSPALGHCAELLIRRGECCKVTSTMTSLLCNDFVLFSGCAIQSNVSTTGCGGLPAFPRQRCQTLTATDVFRDWSGPWRFPAGRSRSSGMNSSSVSLLPKLLKCCCRIGATFGRAGGICQLNSSNLS